MLNFLVLVGTSAAFTPEKVMVGVLKGGKAVSLSSLIVPDDFGSLSGCLSGGQYLEAVGISVVDSLDCGQDVESLCSSVRSLNAILTSELSITCEVDQELIMDDILSGDAPNDPLFQQQWGMERVGLHNILKDFQGSRDTVVGVIDTGIDYNHVDLRDQMWVNEGEIPDDGIDNDGNGYVDDYRGWNFYANTNDPWDDQGHGSHCAGVIGASTDNGKGIASFNVNVRMMPLKFLSRYGSGSTSGAVASLNYAIMMGAHLTSNSYGGGGASSAMRQALAAAEARNMLFVAAAGNSAVNVDFVPHFPCSYNNEFINVLCVASTASNGELSSFSNYGESVDIAAPGSSILSTVPNDKYSKKSGTSMATPAVAGLAALVLSSSSSTLGAGGLSAIMRDSSRRMETLYGKVASGEIDAVSALSTVSSRNLSV